MGLLESVYGWQIGLVWPATGSSIPPCWRYGTSGTGWNPYSAGVSGGRLPGIGGGDLLNMGLGISLPSTVDSST